MNFWFFFSYARLDRDQYLKQFFADLKEEVRTQSGELDEEQVGFFDAESIAEGAQWPETLAGALQRSRAFVSIFSPTYFQKEFCGKEWTVFRERTESYEAAKGQYPPLILPVLWAPENKLPQPLPPTVADIQFKHDDFGANYARLGLKQLLKLSRYKDEYNEFVFRLAEKITDAVKKHPLDPLADLRPFSQIASAFHSAAGAPIVLENKETETSGPRYVQFIYIAEKRSRLMALRQKLDAYGNEGGKDWQPYCPPVKDAVGLLAQDVAVRERLFYEEVKLNGDLIKELEKAEQDHKIVVIVVDTWTLNIEEYRQIMRAYDDRSFVNCVVLVPWNNDDDETTQHRTTLENYVRQSFVKRQLIGSPNSFLYPVNTLEDWKRELSTALNKARERILERAKVERTIEGQRLILKPIISGPGG